MFLDMILTFRCPTIPVNQISANGDPGAWLRIPVIGSVIASPTVVITFTDTWRLRTFPPSGGLHLCFRPQLVAFALARAARPSWLRGSSRARAPLISRRRPRGPSAPLISRRRPGGRSGLAPPATGRLRGIWGRSSLPPLRRRRLLRHGRRLHRPPPRSCPHRHRSRRDHHRRRRRRRRRNLRGAPAPACSATATHSLPGPTTTAAVFVFVVAEVDDNDRRLITAARAGGGRRRLGYAAAAAGARRGAIHACGWGRQILLLQRRGAARRN